MGYKLVPNAIAILLLLTIVAPAPAQESRPGSKQQEVLEVQRALVQEDREGYIDAVLVQVRRFHQLARINCGKGIAEALSTFQQTSESLEERMLQRTRGGYSAREMRRILEAAEAIPEARIQALRCFEEIAAEKTKVLAVLESPIELQRVAQQRRTSRIAFHDDFLQTSEKTTQRIRQVGAFLRDGTTLEVLSPTINLLRTQVETFQTQYLPSLSREDEVAAATKLLNAWNVLLDTKDVLDTATSLRRHEQGGADYVVWLERELALARTRATVRRQTDEQIPADETNLAVARQELEIRREKRQRYEEVVKQALVDVADMAKSQ